MPGPGSEPEAPGGFHPDDISIEKPVAVDIRALSRQRQQRWQNNGRGWPRKSA